MHRATLVQDVKPIPNSTAQSKAAFIAKLSIVIEEADESVFWLEFIVDEKMIKEEMIAPLIKEANELTSIFITSRKTARKKTME